MLLRIRVEHLRGVTSTEGQRCVRLKGSEARELHLRTVLRGGSKCGDQDPTLRLLLRVPFVAGAGVAGKQILRRTKGRALLWI